MESCQFADRYRFAQNGLLRKRGEKGEKKKQLAGILGE